MGVRYLLDTNICIYIAKHSPAEVREHFARHSASELAMSVVTLGELRFGAEKSQSKRKALAALARLEGSIQVAELTKRAGQHYGQIRARLERAGRSIGNNDLWIAAHARSEAWILVTNNEGEFSRVEGLQVENWVGR